MKKIYRKMIGIFIPIVIIVIIIIASVEYKDYSFMKKCLNRDIIRKVTLIEQQCKRYEEVVDNVLKNKELTNLSTEELRNLRIYIIYNLNELSVYTSYKLGEVESQKYTSISSNLLISFIDIDRVQSNKVLTNAIRANLLYNKAICSIIEKAKLPYSRSNNLVDNNLWLKWLDEVISKVKVYVGSH